MELRPYQPQDLDAILELFYETVHAVNRRDYSPASWMPGPQAAGPGTAGPNPWLHTTQSLLWREGRSPDLPTWPPDGYFDRLFVHKDFQRQGIATRFGRLDRRQSQGAFPPFGLHRGFHHRPALF